MKTIIAIEAARALLSRLDRLTTDEFSIGADRREREALRNALEGLTASPPDDAIEALSEMLNNGTMHDDGTFVIEAGAGVERGFAAIAKARGEG